MDRVLRVDEELDGTGRDDLIEVSPENTGKERLNWIQEKEGEDQLDCRGPNIECVRAIFVGDGVACGLRDVGLAGVFEPEAAAEPKRNGGSCKGLGVGATVEGLVGELGGAAIEEPAKGCGAALDSGAFSFSSTDGRVATCPFFIVPDAVRLREETVDVEAMRLVGTDGPMKRVK